MATLSQTTFQAFIKRHPVLTYYVLTFTISWGGMLLVLVIGGRSGLAPRPTWQSDPRFPFLILALLAGPSVAGILLTGLISGKAGLRELLSRLLRWRVGARWYAAALLTIPVFVTILLFVLSLTSPVYLPAIVTTSDKATLLLLGIAVGLGGSFLEELGWTGFAIPRLRLRHGTLTTGLIVGVLWGVWHLLMNVWVSSTASGGISLALFLPVYFLSAVAWLTAYRVLMVWVYDHTESLLVAILMHASLDASTLVILVPPLTGVAFLSVQVGQAAVLWIVVAAVVVANRKNLSQGEHTSAIPVTHTL